MKDLIHIANEVAALERVAADPSYKDYVKKKKKRGEKPLKKDEWEARVKGKGKKEKSKGKHPLPKGLDKAPECVKDLLTRGPVPSGVELEPVRNGVMVTYKDKKLEKRVEDLLNKKAKELGGEDWSDVSDRVKNSWAEDILDNAWRGEFVFTIRDIDGEPTHADEEGNFGDAFDPDDDLEKAIKFDQNAQYYGIEAILDSEL